MNSRWLLRKPQPNARLRLVCFPYAGGSASVFVDWQSALGPHIEVCPVQLPGRGMRLAEPPFTSLDDLLAALVPALQGVDSLPFVFFGHSLGALVAFEVTRLLRRHGMTLPSRLIVSGAAAPRCRDTTRGLHKLPDAQFIDALRDYEGSPAPVLENAELMELLLPMIRADFTLGERYVYKPSLRLPVPLTVLTGTHDRHVPEQDARQWAEETSANCDLHIFEGGHFFLHQQQQAVLHRISAILDDTSQHHQAAA